MLVLIKSVIILGLLINIMLASLHKTFAHEYKLQLVVL